MEIYLNKTVVIQMLDENTDARRKNSLSWDYVFQSAVTFSKLELNIVLSKNKTSYWDRRKQVSGGLPIQRTKIT